MLLDGHHEAKSLSVVCDPDWVAWLLARLTEAGLLADGPPTRPLLAVKVHGKGRVADEITRLLSPARAPRGAERLHVVASDSLESDRVLAADLLEARAPHILVRADEDHACVGPLVVPGLTSCLNCTDLERRDLDPTWPVQAFQMSRARTEADPVLSAWAAALAVAQVRAHAAGLAGEAASTTIEMSRQDGRVTYRGWHRHPDCSCRAAGAPEENPAAGPVRPERSSGPSSSTAAAST